MKMKVLVGFVLLLIQCGGMNPPSIHQGILDLSHSGLNSNSAIPLHGEWRFDWMELIDPGENSQTKDADVSGFLSPGENWKSQKFNGKELTGLGFATYRLKIRFHETDIGKNLAIRFRTTGGAAYKIFKDKEELIELGKLGTSRDTMTPTRLSSIVFFQPDHSETEITVQISNFYHNNGAFWYTPELGSREGILQLSKKKQTIDAASLGAILIISLYYLNIFLFRMENRTALYFSLFCLSISIYNMSVNEVLIYSIFPDLPYSLGYKILNIYCLGIPFYLSFLNSLFPSAFSYLTIRIFWTFYLISYLLILIIPVESISFIETPLMVLVLGSFLYAFWGLMNILKSMNRNTSLLILPNLIFIVSAINDVLSVYEFIPTPMILNYGLIALIFIESFVLSNHFSSAIRQSEDLSKKLISINENLEKTILDRTEELQVAKTTAEEENMWKDRFISLVSHDLKSPIASVLASNHWILESEKELSDSVKEKIKNNNSILFDALTMIKHLLNLSRFRTLVSLSEYSDFDLFEILEEVLIQFRYELENKNLKIETHLPEDVILTSDPIAVKEILRNIIMNAIKFSYPDSKILIQYTETDLKQVLEITDRGIGMSEEVQTTLFSEKTQIHSGTKGERGFGVGLKLSKELFSLLNGNLEVSSKKDHGSTFRLVFPSNRQTVLVFNKISSSKLFRELKQLGVLVIQANRLTSFERLMKSVYSSIYILHFQSNSEELVSICKMIHRDNLQSTLRILILGQTVGTDLQSFLDPKKFPNLEFHYFEEEDLVGILDFCVSELSS